MEADGAMRGGEAMGSSDSSDSSMVLGMREVKPDARVARLAASCRNHSSWAPRDSTLMDRVELRTDLVDASALGYSRGAALMPPPSSTVALPGELTVAREADAVGGDDGN